MSALPVLHVLGALVLLVLATAAAVRFFRRFPWLSLGWGWYLVTLLPVIGLIQVGGQAMADRYTYLPLTGLFVAAVWSAAKAVGANVPARAAAGLAGALLLVSWTLVTRIQIGYWHDDIALFSHSLEVTRESYEAHFVLGRSLQQENRVPEALSHLERAVALKPDDPLALNALGLTLSRSGRRQEAIDMFQRAIAADEKDPDPRRNLIIAHLARNDRAAAWSAYESLRLVSPEAAGQLARFVTPP